MATLDDKLNSFSAGSAAITSDTANQQASDLQAKITAAGSIPINPVTQPYNALQNTIAQSKDNPNQLITGAQSGTTQANGLLAPVATNYQAYTTTNPQTATPKSVSNSLTTQSSTTQNQTNQTSQSGSSTMPASIYDETTGKWVDTSTGLGQSLYLKQTTGDSSAYNIYAAEQKSNELTQNKLNDIQNSINARADEQESIIKRDQANAGGQSKLMMARMGAVGSGAAAAFQSKVEQDYQVRINQLNSMRNDALQKAQDLADQKQVDSAWRVVEELSKLDEEAKRAGQKRLDDLKKMQEIQGKNFEQLVKGGKTIDDIPQEMFDAMDQEYANLGMEGVYQGMSRDLFMGEQSAQNIKNVNDAMEAHTKLNTLLSKIPAGQSIEINGVEYQGLDRGDIKTGTETDADGNVTFWEYDQNSGNITTTSLGSIGKAQDGWDTKFDDEGQPWRFNSKTGEFKPFFPSYEQKNIQQIIPDGSVSPFKDAAGNPRTQCGAWTNDLLKMGVGDTVASKLAKCDPTIKPGSNNPPQVGDMFVQKNGFGWTGHVGIVCGVEESPDGSIKIRCLESNYPQTGKITSSRVVDAKNIAGFGRQDPSKWNPLLKEILGGTDAVPGSSIPTFGAKDKTKKSELDDLLSPTEAKALGVTYGTTKGEAAKLGITPKTTTTDEPTIIKDIGGKPYEWDGKTWVPFKGAVEADENKISAQTDALNSKITLIDELLNSKGLNSSVGPNRYARLGINPLNDSARQEFAAGVNQLVSKDTIDTLINLKAQGGTLGALSDQERIMLQSAATKIGTWMQRDKNGNLTGKFEISEEAFKKELNRIKTLTKSALDRASGSTQSVKITSPDGKQQLQYNLSDPAQKAEYEQAIKAGYKQ
jgi:hypothetical protein